MPNLKAICAVVLCLGADGYAQFNALAPSQPAKPPPAVQIEDSWQIVRDEQRAIMVRTRELKVYPKLVDKPALQHQLVVDSFNSRPGNAAVFYLKAMGFLEQTPARQRVDQWLSDAVERARANNSDISKEAPYVWLDTPPQELPRDQVKEYLGLHAFQEGILKEAADRMKFDMDRDIKSESDPIAYLLPEIQNLRNMARTQSMRMRLAIAEDRIEDAIEVLRQQLTLGSHLGQEEFLVSNLVGIAIASIAWNDALYLAEHPKAPNLYWVLTTLPDPLVSMRRSLATERQFLFMQVKSLRKVTAEPQPAGYWRSFVDEINQEIGSLGSSFDLPSDPADRRTAIVGFIAAGYPGAREYLIQEDGMSVKDVDAMPTAQVVFYATRRFYEVWRDEVFKSLSLPVWQQEKYDPAKELAKMEKRYGICTAGSMLLPFLRGARAAQARCQQNLALLRSVEAIRIYAAENDGELPKSLDQLSVPAPVDPFTGKPLAYELVNGGALVSGHVLPGIQNRLLIRIAK